MQVGNLPPGETATVRLTLAGVLPYSDGEVTFRFPLVVAPRYIPGTPLPGEQAGAGVRPDTDAVPDASRISPPVLLQGFPNPVRLSLSVEVPPLPLAPYDYRSSLHTVAEDEGGRARVFRLLPGERLNRDFILRFRLAESKVKTALSLCPDADGSGGTFLLTVVPPLSAGEGTRPRDVVFVLDRSGSMAGWKMVAARRALGRMVDTLTDHDRFTVLAFDDTIESPPDLGRGLAPATDRNRFRAVEFLAKVDARGGTEMAAPLARAVAELTSHQDAEDRERILVLVTDGQVGNEDQILRQLGKKARQVRIFTLGIDRAVNAGFLRRLADLGGGSSELVESEDRLDEVMDAVHRRIGAPVLTGLKLEPAGLAAVGGSAVPARLPDLFAGAPLLILGRYWGMSEGGLALQGRETTGAMWLEHVEGRADGSPALPAIWARGRLRELEDRYVTATGDKAPLEKEIVDTSLRFGVLCRFTAYVAVDRSEVVNPGGRVHGVVQPVEQPEGWEMVNQPLSAGLFGSIFGAAPAAQTPFQCREMAPRAESEDSHYELSESVDSCLTDFAEEEEDEVRRSRSRKAPPASAKPPSAPPAARGGSGVLRGLLGVFGRKSKKGKQAAPAIDRTAFRQRAADLLREMEAAAGAAPADLLAALRARSDRLEALSRDLVAAGDRHPSVVRLIEVLVALQALPTAPGDAVVRDLWSRTEAALREWLALVPQPPASSGRREGFWK
jgi:Ca-activated chloride channel family protein